MLGRASAAAVAVGGQDRGVPGRRLAQARRGQAPQRLTEVVSRLKAIGRILGDGLENDVVQRRSQRGLEVDRGPWCLVRLREHDGEVAVGLERSRQ